MHPLKRFPCLLLHILLERNVILLHPRLVRDDLPRDLDEEAVILPEVGVRREERVPEDAETRIELLYRLRVNLRELLDG